MDHLVLRIQHADGAKEELSLHSELVVQAMHGTTYSILDAGSGMVVPNLVVKRVKDSLLIQIGEVPLVEIGGYYGSGSEGGSDLCGSPCAYFDLGGDRIVTPDSLIPLLSCRFLGPVAQAD